jgi:hypothetical protein
VIDHAEICRINADGTTTYHWENIEAAAQKWQPGCDGLSVYLSKLLLPLRPSREWQGLTIGELSALYDKHAKCQEEGMLVSGWLDFAAEHDALLKEKNS